MQSVNVLYSIHHNEQYYQPSELLYELLYMFMLCDNSASSKYKAASIRYCPYLIFCFAIERKLILWLPSWYFVDTKPFISCL